MKGFTCYDFDDGSYDVDNDEDGGDICIDIAICYKFMEGPPLVNVGSKVLPLTASCLSPLLGVES